MSYDMEAFAPAKDFSLSATSSSSRVNIEALGRVQVRMWNSGAVPVFFKAGTSTVTATTSSTPLPPGSVECFTFYRNSDDSQIYIAGITASGSATVYITTGDGM